MCSPFVEGLEDLTPAKQNNPLSMMVASQPGTHARPLCSRGDLRPPQVLVQEPEGPDTVDRVWAVKPFKLR